MGFIHGCHSVHTKDNLTTNIQFFVVADTLLRNLQRDGMQIVFSSLFRADQYFRKVYQQDEYYARELSLEDVKALCAQEKIIFNPCAYCNHTTAINASNTSLQDLQREHSLTEGRVALYLQDAIEAQEQNDIEAAIEILMLIVAHLKPEEIRAHEILRDLARQLGDEDLLQISLKNIEILRSEA